MITLPEEFISELYSVIGEDAESYVGHFDDLPFRGISINLIKTTAERLCPLLPFSVKPSPFYKDGFYIPPDTEGLGNLPLHHAGAFYVQEPSASSAVALLQVQPGDYVLDLCAAPGGKSAQIAAQLGGKGLLWSNEPIRSRANILLSNFERMGIPNGVISSCYPQELCPRLEGAFDKVLVDAPCSGEGMFRKNHDAVLEWSRENVLACAQRQLSILKYAAMTLREGGRLVYSTCTFSREENEDTVERFLKECPEFEPEEPASHFGRSTGCSNAVRITPTEGGEGHFAAVFRKKGNALRREIHSGRSKRTGAAAKDALGAAKIFLQEVLKTVPEERIEIHEDSVFIRPAGLEHYTGAGVIRSGIYAGKLMKNRWEPAHALFTCTRPEEVQQVLALAAEDPRTEAYLRGMEIDCDCPKGYTAVAIEGMVTGFGKCSGGRLKNKYPKGLRIL